METITIHDRQFIPYIPAEEIQHRIGETAASINRDFEGKNPLFLAVLNGSFMFASDLLKALTIPCEITFVKLASYSGTGTTGRVKQLIGLNEQIRGRSVVIVEDIIDTGITMEHVFAELAHYEPLEVKLAALLFKPDAFRCSFAIDYLCFSIPNRFVVGYGLDFNGLGRNYPEIYQLKP